MRLNEAIQSSPDAHPAVKAAAAEMAAAKTKGDKLTIMNQFIAQVPEQHREQVSRTLMPLTGYGATDGAASGVLRAPRWSEDAPSAPQRSEQAPTALAQPQGNPEASQEPPADVRPGAIRLRGRTLVVSDESFDRIKAKKHMQQALKASDFDTVETRGGKRKLKL